MSIRWGLWLCALAALLVLGCKKVERTTSRRDLPYEMMNPDMGDASNRRIDAGVIPGRELIFKDAGLLEVLAAVSKRFNCPFDVEPVAATYARERGVRFNVRSGDLTDDLLFEWARGVLEMKGFKLIPVEHGFRVVRRTTPDFTTAKN